MLPNVLSFLRLPLAFLFLFEDSQYRALAIVFALITDGLDGFLARRYSLTSKLGTLLDPLTDKFFVLFALVVFISEGQLTLGEAITMGCRDIALLFFGLYLVGSGNLKKVHFRSIWCGKVSTCLQLMVLFGLTYHFYIPVYVYGSFMVLGVLAFFELYLSNENLSNSIEGTE